MLNSSKLDDNYKKILEQLIDINYLSDQENSNRLNWSLKFLAWFLYEEYDKYPILLIDEYDVPLKRAAYHDNHRDNEKGYKAVYHYYMEDLMSSFFSILKDAKTTTKIIVTGGLRVYKNRLYSGTNFTPNSANERVTAYTGMFGFTEEETLKFLKDYSLDDWFSKVKEHYAGYKFFDKEIFNPVDVVNFVKDNIEHKEHDSEIKTDTYWCDLVSDQELTEHIVYLTDHATQYIQDLVDGKSITFSLNDSMNYDILSENNTDDILSLLLHKGYLTIDWDATDALDESSRRYNNICAKLPNLEIRDFLIKTFQDRFSSEFVRLNLHTKLVDALTCGSQKEAYNIFFDMLQKYVSIRDTATKAPLENFYHGFLNSIFACCEDIISEYHSNYESGSGYADIIFNDLGGTKACVIEIKVCKEKESRAKKANEAIEQILDKHYVDEILEDENITTVTAVGIAFYAKNCAVACKKIK